MKYQETLQSKGKAVRTIRVLRETEEESYDPLDSNQLTLEEKMVIIEDKDIWQNKYSDNVGASYEEMIQEHFDSFATRV